MDLTDHISSRKPTALALSVMLWLVSVVLAGLAVFALRDLLIWGLALVIPQAATDTRPKAADVINLAQQCGMIIFGMTALVVLIYCTDHLIRDAGQPRLLRALARIIAVEAVIVLPVWWLLWR